jgi:FtsH-binding integral membrane protein
MSPVTKAALTLAGFGGLIGVGTTAFSGRSEAAQAIGADVVWPEYVKQRVHQTYGYVAMGLAGTATSALVMYRTGVAHRVASMNPWAFLGLSLVGTIGSMMVVQFTPYQEGSYFKPAALMLFNTCMGASLCSLGFVGGPILLQAAAGTGLMVGSLSLVAANSPSDTFLWMAGPLTVGLGVVVVSSFGVMFFPASGFLHSISLYGGLGLFGGMVLFDTSKVITHAKQQAHFDPIQQSLSVYLDTINIFVRLVNILAMNKRK